jgi:hypothetical protein
MTISYELARSLCRLGTGSPCCRYLAAGAEGFGCLKLDPKLKAKIDARVAAGTFNAKGDNCPGKDMG